MTQREDVSPTVRDVLKEFRHRSGEKSLSTWSRRLALVIASPALAAILVGLEVEKQGRRAARSQTADRLRASRPVQFVKTHPYVSRFLHSVAVAGMAAGVIVAAPMALGVIGQLAAWYAGYVALTGAWADNSPAIGNALTRTGRFLRARVPRQIMNSMERAYQRIPHKNGIFNAALGVGLIASVAALVMAPQLGVNLFRAVLAGFGVKIGGWAVQAYRKDEATRKKIAEDIQTGELQNGHAERRNEISEPEMDLSTKPVLLSGHGIEENRRARLLSIKPGSIQSSDIDPLGR